MSSALNGASSSIGTKAASVEARRANFSFAAPAVLCGNVKSFNSLPVSSIGFCAMC